MLRPIPSPLHARAAAAGLPARLKRWWAARPLGDLARLVRLGGSGPQPVVALMLGELCHGVRVEPRPQGLWLAAAESGEVADLQQWKPWLRGARVVLVLGAEQRSVQALDRPEVPDEELAQALRWPLAEALGAEPEQLLTAAVPLPRLSAAMRPQVLGVACRIEVVKPQLQALEELGLQVRHIDVIDSALRGMVLLQQPMPRSTVAVCLIGDTVSIGLLRDGQITGLRSVPLPQRQGHADLELAEQLALDTRRTFDHYERLALLEHRDASSDEFAVGAALASVGSLSQAGHETFTSALSLPPRLFSLEDLTQGPDAVQQACRGHDQLTALACVAVARLQDHGVQVQPRPEVAA